MASEVLAPHLIPSTRRFRELDRLDAYYCGRQYLGKPNWWTGEAHDGSIVPLRERAPCIIYPLPKACVNQATRFTFGEGRFPQVHVDVVESVDAANSAMAVDEDESECLTSLVSEITTRCGLRAVMQRMMRRGLSARSAVIVISLRAGVPAFDFPHARDCLPEFDVNGDVTRLVWCYQFDKLVVGKDGKVNYVRHWFRRDFDAVEFVTYEDVEVDPGNSVPEWVRDEPKCQPHGFGFCPVVWVRNLGGDYDGEIDGDGLYDELLEEFDALNFALSQRHRGIVYFGTPQAYEIGAEQDESIGAFARTSRSEPSKKGRVYSPAEEGPFGVTAKARKKAPDEIWSYRNTDAKAGILETTGAAFEATSKHVQDVKTRILESIDVVISNPEHVMGHGGDISGKALYLLFAPLLALVDELRECWWPYGLEAILSMALRIIAVRPDGIYIPYAKRGSTILQRFFVDGMWIPPKMTPQWGAYFSPSSTEISDSVNSAIAAKNARLISSETATRYVANDFGVSDVTAEMDDAKAEADEAAAQAMGMQTPVGEPKLKP